MNAEFYRELLSDQESALYAVILENLKDRSELIRFPPVSSQTVNRIISFVLRDHPEIAWTNGKWRGEAGTTSFVIPDYTLDEAEIRTFQAETSRMAEALDSALRLSEEQRLRQVFDFLLESIAYDLYAPHSQDAYGALIEGRAVCRGIAKAVQLLLRACGLHAITLEGRLNREARHVWNVVSLSSGCYHLDVTMGYPAFSALYTNRGLNYHSDAAFCVSDETLRRTHEWGTEAIPIRCPFDLYDRHDASPD